MLLPHGALLLRLGYTGLQRKVAALCRRKKNLLQQITGENPRRKFQPPSQYPVDIDMRYITAYAKEKYYLTI